MSQDHKNSIVSTGRNAHKKTGSLQIDTIQETPLHKMQDSDFAFGHSSIHDGKRYLVNRTLTKGCPKIMKLVNKAQDELITKQRRKPIYQFVSSPKTMGLSYNKNAMGGGANNLLNQKKYTSTQNTITNQSASTAPSNMLKSGFEFSNRVSI